MELIFSHPQQEAWEALLQSSFLGCVLHISGINPPYRPSALKSALPVKSLCGQYTHLCRRSGTSLGAVLHTWGDIPVSYTLPYTSHTEGDHHVLSAHSPHPTSRGVPCRLNTPQPVPAWRNVPHGLLTFRTAQLQLSTGN